VKSKKEIIIFGFGNAGKAAFRFYEKDFEITAFCDNDDQKWNLGFRGIRVVRPSELTTMNYDYIYLASHKAYEIYRDLITDGIDKKKLVIVPTNVILGQYDMPSGAYKVFILTLYFLALPFLWLSSFFTKDSKSNK
jgi:hypothetical protein